MVMGALSRGHVYAPPGGVWQGNNDLYFLALRPSFRPGFHTLFRTTNFSPM